ncbi:MULTISPECIES: hypothetical protein [Burkholderia]|uniref:Uncharacterized protein n=1 Tax=Burkholderia multivorans TaxID=87883 RepID=A0A8E2RQH8_9BURK|nr:MULTISPECIES: hypothetical protein [Burkholderia]KOE24407.1 hypothetical protein AI46_19505 [Burkholderia multivorans R-20526]KVS18889.1 hypothetical protein WK33_01715 [Burkholderia multivorans]MBH9661755.1 hypothetical protein [Burkholderia multivorans]MBJ9684130.1 hypothetical protein [Burkholderia multivorans]MBU9181942.1 hypothetical protein [Burkholderia multivorans]
MNAQSLSGMLRAQELLLVSMVRTLPVDARGALVELFTEQIAFAEQAGLESRAERDVHDAFVAHARNLLIRLESLA